MIPKDPIGKNSIHIPLRSHIDLQPHRSATRSPINPGLHQLQSQRSITSTFNAQRELGLAWSCRSCAEGPSIVALVGASREIHRHCEGPARSPRRSLWRACQLQAASPPPRFHMLAYSIIIESCRPQPTPSRVVTRAHHVGGDGIRLLSPTSPPSHPPSRR